MFSAIMNRSSKPSASPAPSLTPIKSRTPTIRPVTGTSTRKTGIVSGPQEIRIHQLQQLALALSLQSMKEREDPLITAINETVKASGVGSAEKLGRLEYEAVERRLEEVIQRRGGRVPSRG